MKIQSEPLNEIDPERILCARDDLRAVLGSVKNKRNAIALALRLRGWTYREIGEFFGVGLERARQRCQKALHDLRRKYPKRFIYPPPKRRSGVLKDAASEALCSPEFAARLPRAIAGAIAQKRFRRPETTDEYLDCAALSLVNAATAGVIAAGRTVAFDMRAADLACTARRMAIAEGLANLKEAAAARAYTQMQAAMR